MAKEIIASGSPLSLPPLDVEDMSGRLHRVRPATRVLFDRVDVEMFEDGLRPDLIGSVAIAPGHLHQGLSGNPGDDLCDDRTGVRRLIIEIRVSHRVEPRKLALLRVRGDSVLEIDLSRVARDLDRADLAALLLDGAPRAWLFHRNGERHREAVVRKVADDAARRQARRDWAIAAEAREEEVRRVVLAMPPTVEVSSQMTLWAEAEQARWRMIGCGALFDVDVPDGIFDVAPDLWRAVALMPLAPWAENPLLAIPDISRIAPMTGKMLRAKGWVKTPFVGELYRYTNRKRPWDPVGDAVGELLSGGLLSLGYGDVHQRHVASPDHARREMVGAWGRCNHFIDRLASVAARLAGQGVEMRMQGRQTEIERPAVGVVIAPEDGSGGSCEIIQDVPLFSREEIVWGVQGNDRLDILLCGTSLLDRLTHTMEKGTASGRLLCASDIERHGIVLTLPGDRQTGGTQRALAHLAHGQRTRWEREIESHLGRRADSLLSVFLALVEDCPDLEGWIRDAGRQDLLDIDAIRCSLAKPVDLCDPDPVGVACSAINAAGRPLLSLARQLRGVLDLAAALSGEYPSGDGGSDKGQSWPELAAFIRAAGISIGLCPGGLPDPAALNGVLDGAGVAQARGWIAEVCGFAGRWNYGADFAQRALEGHPPESGATLLDLILAGRRIEARKAIAGIRSRRDRPGWAAPSHGAFEARHWVP